VLAALGLLALAGCSANTSADALLAARINGQPVTLAQYDSMLRFTTASSGIQGQTADLQSPSGRGVLAADQQSALAWLLDRALAQQALAQQHLSVTSDERKAAQGVVDGYVAQVRQQVQMQPDNAQLRALNASLTPDTQRIIVDRLSAEQALADKGSFPSAHVRAIIVDSQDTAKKLLQQVQQGADFGQLAHDKSLDSGSASKNGDLGTVYIGQLPAEFNDAVFAPHAHPQKYVIAPVGTNYGLFEVTNVGKAPLPKDQASQNGTQIVDNYLTTVVQPTSSVDQYITLR
jgi:parvulin-like peptidyl-prolyl isomerase